MEQGPFHPRSLGKIFPIRGIEGMCCTDDFWKAPDVNTSGISEIKITDLSVFLDFRMEYPPSKTLLSEVFMIQPTYAFSGVSSFHPTRKRQVDFVVNLDKSS